MYHVLNPEHAGKQILTGWSLSIVLHGVLLVAVITFMPNLMVAVQKETFRWNVALVDRPQEQAPAPPTVQESKPVPSPATPQRQAARAVEPVPQAVPRQFKPERFRNRCSGKPRRSWRLFSRSSDQSRLPKWSTCPRRR